MSALFRGNGGRKTSDRHESGENFFSLSGLSFPSLGAPGGQMGRAPRCTGPQRADRPHIVYYNASYPTSANLFRSRAGCAEAGQRRPRG
jgi:hypothetical protein